MKSLSRKTIFFVAALLLCSSAAFAVTITGTVKNATTGKAAAGDNVDLLSMQQGMSVLASTKTDAGGSFSFNVDDANSPHLVRVTHDGVSYFPAGGPMQPGATTVSLDVYDAAHKVDGISTTVDVLRFQSDGSTLQVMELIAVRNASNPPRSLSGDKTYEFSVPDGAQIDQVLTQAPGGMSVNSSATPDGKNRYAFSYALKPGETRFQVAYHLPYSGQANFSPRMTGDVQHFVVMLPKSMKFEPKGSAKFSLMDDPNSTIQVATNVNAASSLGFEISGTGMLQEQQEQQQNAGQQPTGEAPQGGASVADNRPGGGLGPPIDAPDPLYNYRVPILAGLGIVLICGAVLVVSRSNQQIGQAVPVTGVAAKVAATPVTTNSSPKPVTSIPPPADKSAMLLEGLKEELFQLEVEKQQGRISEAEYESAKAALDATLKRALARRTI